MSSSASHPPDDHSGDPLESFDLIAAGDQRAQCRFFDTYAASVFRLVAFTLGLDDDDADDVVQETMIAAFKGIGSYDRSKKVRTWLFGIAKHKANDFLRSRMRTGSDEPVRAEVPWSALNRGDEGDESLAPDTVYAGANGDDGSNDRVWSPGVIEVTPGEAAVIDGQREECEDEGDVDEIQVPVAMRTPPPSPPQIGEKTPYKVWAGEIATWLATQPAETHIIVRRFTHGASFEQLAADLSDHVGRPVKEAAVRQRASRFSREFSERFDHLLPRSRVRIPASSVPEGMRGLQERVGKEEGRLND